jgi:hypothetical protein
VRAKEEFDLVVISGWKGSRTTGGQQERARTLFCLEMAKMLPVPPVLRVRTCVRNRECV